MAIGFIVMIASIIFGVVTPSAATIADCPETECITVVAPRLPADFGYGIDLFTAPSIDFEFNIAPPETLPDVEVPGRLTHGEVLECTASIVEGSNSSILQVAAFNACSQVQIGRATREVLCDLANPAIEVVLLGGIATADRLENRRLRSLLTVIEAGLLAISTACWLDTPSGPGPGREIP